MREVIVAKRVEVKDPLLEAMAAAIARIEEKVDRLLAAQNPEGGRIVIHTGPVSEQKE